MPWQLKEMSDDDEEKEDNTDKDEKRKLNAKMNKDYQRRKM